ncbi:ATP-dependent translocase ABCB1, partial [Lamellibrachia satsuma]
VTVKMTFKQGKAYKKAGSIAKEVLSSIRTVAAFGGESKDAIRYQECLLSARKIGIIKGTLTGLSLGCMWFCNFSMVGLANWYGTSLVVSDTGTSAGNVIFVMMVILAGSVSLGQSLPNLEGIATAGGSAQAIFEIIDTKPHIDSGSDNGLKPDHLLGNIELKHVDFVYESRPEIKVLDQVSLKMEVGQTIALVGPSGSGKSTICHLLLRLYDSTVGQLTIDGYDIKDINVKWLRQAIGVVSQEPVLFDGSISDNIRLGREGATPAEIEDAAKMANAHNFIVMFPDKYNTLVGQQGTQMSGGQKQRIAIARALISNPKILLLDEATSALDSESEAIVQDALEKASRGRTTIVVALRLSTIRNADVIHCLTNGRIVESGSHDELMNQEGPYYELVTSQQFQQKRKNNKIDTDDVIIDECSPRDATFDATELKNKLNDSYEDDEQSGKKTEEHIKLEGGDKSVFLRLLKLNAAEWPYITIGCFTSFCAGSFPPMFAFVYSLVIKNFAVVDQNKQMSEARTFSIIVIGAALLIGSINCVSHWSWATVGENLTVRLRKVVFSRMLQQEIGWFDLQKNKVGVLTSRLAVDATIVRGAGGNQLGLMVLAASSLIVALVIAFVASWKLCLAVLVFLPFLFAAGSAHGRDMKGSAERAIESADQGGKIASEAISNIRTVAALTVEAKFEEKFNHMFYSFVKKERIEAARAALFYGFSQSIAQFAYVVAFYYGAHLVSQGEIEFENIFRSASFAPDAHKAREAAKHIFDLLDRKPHIEICADDAKFPTECRGEVTFDNIEFTYPSRQDATVLRGLAVTIKPGQRVALVGQSGCGKSTCVSLVERFYDASNGTVLIDGVDVRSLNVQWLRAQLALVSQEPVLFNTTIHDNIAYGDNARTPTMDEVIAAAKKANIHNFIASLPLGYDTNVGEGGSQLSGGQKQRIAIARALLRNPRILLLDEATSALDTENEKLVQEALERAQEGRTCIVIAHRLSTIRSADKIVVMQDGRVVEEGTHVELMAQESFYYRLVQKQVGALI